MLTTIKLDSVVTSLPVDSPSAGFAILSGTNSHMNTAQVIHLLRARTPTHTHNTPHTTHTHTHTHTHTERFRKAGILKG